MENVSEIHSSKCECPGGYDGDPYDFSQELKDCLCPGFGYGECV